MVQLIVGKKGKGKTKVLLDLVNSEVKKAQGNVVYLDSSTKKMYELNNRVRLIAVPDYLVSSSDEFVGFICGIISQDHDLEKVYLDSFMKVARVEQEGIEEVLIKLGKISEKFSIDFVVSVSIDGTEVPKAFQSNVIESL